MKQGKLQRGKLQRGKRGFTLIELLIVVAIIGVIASILIPNMLEALERAKQRRTVADAKLVGEALMSVLTDLSSAAAAGQATQPAEVNLANYDVVSHGVLEGVLATRYIQQVPELDGWKNPFDYHLNNEVGNTLRVMAIRSFGQQGVADGETYPVEPFVPSDFERDIVWVDGYFARWPENVKVKRFDEIGGGS